MAAASRAALPPAPEGRRGKARTRGSGRARGSAGGLPRWRGASQRYARADEGQIEAAEAEGDPEPIADRIVATIEIRVETEIVVGEEPHDPQAPASWAGSSVDGICETLGPCRCECS